MTTSNLPLRDANLARIAAQFPLPTASLPALLEATGPHRTLGGVDVYLALRARMPGTRAGEVATELDGGRLCVGPTVRGCIYLDLGGRRVRSLGIAALLARDRIWREFGKVGVDAAEVERIIDAACAVLAAQGPLSTDALRRALPDGLVRSLGDAGKKLGLSSPLPPTLRLLEFDGRIARKPEAGRLEAERYVWRLSEPFVAGPREALVASLAADYFRWAGVATLEAFADWSGLGKRECKAAVETLGLTRRECAGTVLLGPAEALDPARLAAAAEVVALLPFEDNLIAFANGLAGWVDPAWHQLRIPEWGSKREVTLGESRYAQLRPILAEGKVAGFWEFDPALRRIVAGFLDAPQPATRERVAALAADTAVFLEQDFGHAKSYLLDNEAEMARRCAAVRALPHPLQ